MTHGWSDRDYESAARGADNAARNAASGLERRVADLEARLAAIEAAQRPAPSAPTGQTQWRVVDGGGPWQTGEPRVGVELEFRRIGMLGDGEWSPSEFFTT